MNTDAAGQSGRRSARLRDLNRLLKELLQDHEQLIDVMQRKLLAMRQNDVQCMSACTHDEEQLLRRIGDREQMRRRLLELIIQDLGLQPAKTQCMSISELCAHLSEQEGIGLQALGRQLAKIMKEIAKVNKAVSGFATLMLTHYRRVFEDITRGVDEVTVYAPGGHSRMDTRAQVVDATG